MRNKMSTFKNVDYNKIYLLITGILLFFSVWGLLYGNLSSWDIWADEACTIASIQKTFQEMTYATAIDVHPPLYYYIVWLINKFFDLLIELPIKNVIILCRLISLIPLLILFGLSFRGGLKQQKELLLLPFLLLQYYPISHFTAEVRMYSWGIFFLALVAGTVVKIDKEMSNFRLWFWLVLVSIFSCYTHYFVIIPTVIIWLIFGILHIKENGFIKKYLLFGFVVIVAYIPWVFALYKQMQMVYESYWISETNGNVIKSIFSYITSGNSLYRFILIGIVICCIGISIIMVKQHEDRNSGIYAIAFMLMPYLVMGLSYVIGKVYRPVLFERYIVPSLGVAAIGQLIPILWLLREKRKVGFVMLTITTFFSMYLSFYNVRSFIIDEQEYGKNWNRMIAEIGDVEEVSFIYEGSGNSLFRPLSQVYSENEHLCTKPNESEFSKVLFGVFPYSEEVLEKEVFVFVGEGEESSILGESGEFLGTYKLMYGKYDLYLQEKRVKVSNE